MIANVKSVEIGNEELCNVCNKKDYGVFATIKETTVCEDCSRELFTKLSIFVSRKNKENSQWQFFQ